MNEELKISGRSKAERYEELLPQLKGLTANERNWVGVLANSAAALRQAMGYFWVGFYLTDTFVARHGVLPDAGGSGERLLLGPFQGDIACYNIGKGRGVCGTAWQQGRTIVVRDVEEFPGHIACSSLSRSEIVIPLTWKNETLGVLDIDSDKAAAFDDTDRLYLEQVADIIAQQVVGC